MFTRKPLQSVVPADFPELANLVWNRDIGKPITGEEALALYERNWRHVDKDNLTQAERELILNLAKEFGNGILLVP